MEIKCLCNILARVWCINAVCKGQIQKLSLLFPNRDIQLCCDTELTSRCRLPIISFFLEKKGGKEEPRRRMNINNPNVTVQQRVNDRSVQEERERPKSAALEIKSYWPQRGGQWPLKNKGKPAVLLLGAAAFCWTPPCDQAREFYVVVTIHCCHRILCCVLVLGQQLRTNYNNINLNQLSSSSVVGLQQNLLSQSFIQSS